MANFVEFRQKAKDTVETIADRSVELYKVAEEKARLLAKITKLSTEIAFEKGDLRKHYRELGKLYYELHRDAPEESLAQSCAEIAASKEVIACKQREIDALRGFADFESVSPDLDAEDEKDGVEIIIEDYDESMPGRTPEPLKSVQDTDDLEEPEGDAGLGKTPPSFRL
jgi:glutamine synthetase adenylyltransferase